MIRIERGPLRTLLFSPGCEPPASHSAASAGDEPNRALPPASGEPASSKPGSSGENVAADDQGKP